MTITTDTVNREIGWDINNVSLILEERHNQKDDYFDEPPLYITKSIKFTDDKWDISDETHKNIKCRFSSIKSNTFRVLSKKVVTRLLFKKRNKNITVGETFRNIKSFIRFLEKEKYMYDLRYLTPAIVDEYIEGFRKRDRNMGYLNKKLSAIGEFLKEVEISGYGIDLSEYRNILSSISWEEIKAEVVANRTPNIPKRIFNRVVQVALNDIDDESLAIEDRMMACLIVILSHTGMRRGELQLLEANKLKDITILNKKEKAYILEFFTYKTTRTKKGRWTKTIAFPKTIKAYQTLEVLSEERRIKEKTNYLYCNKKGKRYSKTNFTNRFDMFFYRHQELFNGLTDSERTQVHYQNVDSVLMRYLRRKFPNIIIGEMFFTLNPHQFRVAFANVLKDKVSLQWIREHMNHLDEEMTKHYFRDDIVKETLYKRASFDGNSLELDPDGQNNFIRNELTEPQLKKAYEEINKFLKKKKLNIYKDIDEIINTLKYSPLRENIVGVCTKHLGILCARQYRLATFEKWYYLSPTIPNIESFDFTFKRFLDKAKIVQHNKQLVQQDSKYQRDYENEYSALIKFYQNRVLPEQELLLSILNEKGEEYILFTYPQLENVVSKIDDVNKEIAQWVSKLKLESI
jgi:integrase